MAEALLEEVLEWGEFPITLNLEVMDMKGAANIVGLLERMPSILGRIEIVGILDGDMTAIYSGHAEAARMAFLPFEPTAEDIFLEILQAGKKPMLDMIARTNESVQQALADNAAPDKHDRFRLVAQDLGYTSRDLAKRLFAVWAKANRKQLQEFKRELAKLLDVSV